MAIYYVNPSGSNTAPYDTWGKAATLPQTVVTHGGTVAGPHTVYVQGPVSGYFDLNHANWDNATITGVKSQSDLTPAAPGGVVVTFPSAQWGVHFRSRSGAVAKGLTLQGAAGSYDALAFDSTNCRAEQIYVVDPGRNLIRAGAGSGNVVERCLLSGATDYGILVLGTGSITLNYCVVKASPTKTLNSTAVRNQGSGTLSVNNSLILGQHGDAVENYSTGTTTLTNCILGAGQKYGGGYAWRGTAGTLTITNSLAFHQAFSTTGVRGLSTGTATVTGLLNGAKWGVKKLARSGFIIPRIDDSVSAGYAASLIPVFQSRGVKGQLVVDVSLVNDHAENIRTCYESGVFEVGAHSYSHSTMDLTGSVFSITKNGATITVDRASDTITVSPGGTVTGFKTKTLTAIRTELAALGCTLGTLLANLEGDTLGEILADSSGSQPSPYSPQILIDTTAATGFYRVEMGIAKEQLEAFLGTSVTSFANPKGATNANAQAACLAAGYDSMIASLSASDRQVHLSSLDLFKMGYMWGNALVGATDEETRQHVRALCVAVEHSGMIVAVISHDDATNGIEVTAEQWGVILDTIAEFQGITVTSQKDAVRAIKANGTQADTRTWTRAWVDDFNLSNSDSVCPFAGTAVTGVHDQSTPPTDYGGNLAHFIDIGPTSEKSRHLTADFAPTGYAVRGTETEPAILEVNTPGITIDLTGLTNNEHVRIEAKGKEFKLLTDKTNHSIKAKGGGGRSRLGL